MTDSIRLAIGESSPVNVSPSLTNSMRTPRLVSPARCGASHQVARQPIHAMHHHGVAFAHEGQQPFKFGTLCVLAGSLVGEHLADLNLFQLPFRILVEAADANVADALTLQDASKGKVSG
jgi:hypothetical protein